MKAIIISIIMALSLQAHAAKLEYCSYGGKTMHVVTPSTKTTKALDKVLKSNKSNQEKVSEISNILQVEATTLDNGSGFCEMAVGKYKNATLEKCAAALTTRDMGENMIDEYEIQEMSTRCKVGVNAMLFMLMF